MIIPETKIIKLDEIALINNDPSKANENNVIRNFKTGQVIKCEGVFYKGYNYLAKKTFNDLSIIFNKEGEFVTAHPGHINSD